SELLKLHVPGQYGHGQAGAEFSSAVAWFRPVPSSDWLGQQQQGVSLLSVSAEWPEQQQQQAGAASVCRTGGGQRQTTRVALASKNAAKLTAEIRLRQGIRIVREARPSRSTINLIYCTLFPSTSNASSR